nr:MAG: hypothetical protein [Bacteriophage sp.]
MLIFAIRNQITNIFNIDVMKKNESKVINFVATKVAEQLEGIKNSKTKTSKASTSKVKKTKKELVQDAQEAATNFANAKLVELSPKTKTSKKAQVVKEVKEQQKPSIIEQVISNREVKYVYPDDVVDTLARKKWRQQTRNELHRLELAMARIKDTNSKEFKAAAKAYEDFKKKVLKPEQVA